MIVRSSLAGLFLTVFTAGSACSQQERPSLWFDLEAGPYVPSFQVEYMVDPSRPWCSEGSSDCSIPGRPIRVFIWSPGTSASGEALGMGDFLGFDPDREDLQAYDDIVDARAEDTFGRQFFGDEGEQLTERLRAERSGSFTDAIAAPGPFPLVLHSLGRNNFQLESTVLWEYLASHGFVVAVVPQIGISPESNRLDFSAADMQIQAADLAYVARVLRGGTGERGDRYGIIGHSSGAVAALLVASEDPDVAAIVSLDGSISTEDGHNLLEPLGWAGRSLQVSLLNIYRADKGGLDLWAVETVDGLARYDVAVAGAIHFDFQNWPLYNARWDVVEARSEAVRSQERGRDAFLASIQLSREFLRGVLEGDSGALDRVRNGPWPRAFAGDGAAVRYVPAD